MADIRSIDKQRERTKAQWDEFWFKLGATARKLYPTRGFEWAALGVDDQNALALIRKGWETEHERQLKIN